MDYIDFKRRQMFNMTRLATASGEPPVWLAPCKTKLLRQCLITGNSDRSVLAGYTRLEYIESDGNQYIDTGYDNRNAAVNITYKIKYQTTPSTSGTGLRTMLGAYNGSNRMGNICHRTDGMTAIPFGTVGSGSAPVKWDTTSDIVEVITSIDVATSKYTIWKNGEKVANNLSISGTFKPRFNYNLFASTGTTGDVAEKCSGKVYRLEIWEDGVKKVDFLPAQRVSDNVVGMYNVVGDSFVLNSGTGTFTAGAASNQPYMMGVGDGLPSEYKELEYIQSSGTQYIDTGVIPTGSTGIKMRISIPQLYGGYNKAICGSANGSDKNRNGQFALDIWDGGIYCPFGTWSSSTHRLVVANNTDTVYDFELNYRNSGYVRRDNTQAAIPAYSGTWTSPSIYLFAANCNGTVSASYANLPIKLYRTEITEDNALVRNFIPAQRISDNVIGMYDTVTDTFFTNSGTNDFTAGPELGYEVSVKVSGKNLYFGTSCPFARPSTWTDVECPLAEGITFTFSVTPGDATYHQISFHNANGAYIDYYNANNPTPGGRKYRQFTVPAGTKYWCIYSVGGTVTDTKPMILEGSATAAQCDEYESPFIPQTTATYLDKPLYKVGNVADTFDPTTGVHTENIRIVVLDGTESFFAQSGTGVTNQFYFTASDKLRTPNGSGILCTHLKEGTGADRSTNTKAIFGYANNDIIYMNFGADSELTTVPLFKAWLAAQYAAGTPMTIYYPLATPVVTQHTASQISSHTPSCCVDVLTEVKPSNISITYEQ